MKKSEQPREEYRKADRVVLSDPAQRDGTAARSKAQHDCVTFWRDPSCEGLEAAATRLRNHCFRPHTHDNLMIGLIDVGTKFFMRGRTRNWAAPGSISVVNAGDLHTGSRARGDELRYRALYIPVAVLADAAGTPGAGDPPGFQSGVIEDPLVFAALARLHSAIVCASSALEREQLLLEAIRALTSCHGSAWRPRDQSIAEAPAAVRAAYELIYARFIEDLSVSSVASAVGSSPYHLMRQFRRHVGMPMHALQTQRRVDFGRRLLLQGMPASTVALEIGFADQSHFSKRFKDVVGTSPASYQRNMLTKNSGSRPGLRMPADKQGYGSLRKRARPKSNL